MNAKSIITGIFYAIVVALLLYFVAYQIWFENGEYAGSDNSLRLTEVLLGLSILVAAVSAIVNIIHHPKESIKILVGIGVLALIGFIGYTVSEGEILKKYIEFGVEEASQSKWIDAGLYLMYGTLGIAVLGIIAAEINSAFKS